MARRPAPAPDPPAQAKRRALAILDILAKTYPEAVIELDFVDTYQLLVSVVLSAQCTDARVNAVTPGLFARYPDFAALASADEAELAQAIRTCGLFRSKSKNLISAAQRILTEHGGELPRDYASLVKLPGIGRKSAHVILANAFGEAVFAVDTHIRRVAHRLGFANSTDPLKVERAFCALAPPERWALSHHLLIWHGRRCCHARRPECGRCAVGGLCEWEGKGSCRSCADHT